MQDNPQCKRDLEVALGYNWAFVEVSAQRREGEARVSALEELPLGLDQIEFQVDSQQLNFGNLPEARRGLR